MTTEHTSASGPARLGPVTTAPSNSSRACDSHTTYEVRLAGHLDDRWLEWFGAHTLVRNGDASTTLTVEVADQAELHGLLSRIRDMGVTLLSLNRQPSTSSIANRDP